MRTMLSALALFACVVPVAAVAQVPPDVPASARPGAATEVIVVGEGGVTRAPDTATLSAGVQTSDDASGAEAIAKNAAIYDRLKAVLVRFGIDASQIRTTFYNSSYVPRSGNGPVFPQQRPGYSVSRQVQVRIAHVDDVGKIVDAAVGAGVTNVNNVQFGLADRKSASDAALALALEDAASQARVVATASRMRIVGVKLIQTGANNGFNGNRYDGMPIKAPAPMPGSAEASTIDLPPSTVDVQSSVTVTYFLK